MYILNEKIRNRSNTIRNLEYRDSGKGNLMKNYLDKGILKHNPSSVKEWYNSIYSLEKNDYIKTLPLRDILIYKLFDIYFNLNRLKKYSSLSMDKIFVGKPEIKHFNNKIYITLYVFNKWITHFHKLTKVMKIIKIPFTQKSKQFVIENRPFLMGFLMGVLLFKYPEFYQKLIIFIRQHFIKMFNNNKMSTELFYKNVFTSPFDKTELHKLLDLSNDTDINIERSLFDKRGLNEKMEIINKNIFKLSNTDKKVKRYLYLYLYIINYFFNYIKFPKMINILKKILLYNLKEKRTSSLKIMLEKSGKIYFTKLQINSLYLFIKLINLFLMLKKILKSIYIIKWYKRNIYFSRYKFQVKNILNIKNILNKLYNNNRIEINIINLKYLHLDGNILALAVVKKLKSRNRRVLKVIRMALRLSKKPYINGFYSNLLGINNLNTVFIKKNLNLSINNNIPLNNDLVYKPISYKSRIVFYYLKHKIISGMKLQGTGRLTKRLTASRSISKYIGKGSLKNITSSYNGLSAVVLRGYVKSNLQYVNINSYNRIGTYGIKSWISGY